MYASPIVLGSKVTIQLVQGRNVCGAPPQTAL
jgi:hypothetical protein